MWTGATHRDAMRSVDVRDWAALFGNSTLAAGGRDDRARE